MGGEPGVDPDSSVGDEFASEGFTDRAVIREIRHSVKAMLTPIRTVPFSDLNPL